MFNDFKFHFKPKVEQKEGKGPGIHSSFFSDVPTSSYDKMYEGLESREVPEFEQKLRSLQRGNPWKQ